MMPLARPANCFSAVRRPIIFRSAITSGSPVNSGVKFSQQSIATSDFRAGLPINAQIISS
jgi:hypothetical protein